MIEFILATVAPSLAIAFVFGFIARVVSPKLGLVDRPGHRKIHMSPIPLGGGVVLWTAIFLPLVMGVIALRNFPLDTLKAMLPAPESLSELVTTHTGGLRQQSGDLLFLFACATVLMALGLADDLRGLNWRWRLLIQFCVASAIVFGRGWKLTLFVDLPLLTDLISVLWIVGLINSFNMLDNMDGLSAGIAAICSGMLAAVLLLAPDPKNHAPQLFVAGLLLVIVGSLIGFLWHNRAPARLFMGDAGSYLIGFLVAVAAMLGTFAGGELPKHAVLAPLCILAVPLYDTISVVCIRLRNGRSPFEGDKNHFSHRLVDLGLSKAQAVLTIWLTTAACGLSALVLYQVNTLGAVSVTLAIACLLTVIAILETTARRHASEKPSPSNER